MIGSLDHINIVVSDLNESTVFFKLLGFIEGDSSCLEGEWISAIVGLKNVKAEYVSLSHPGSNTSIELIKYFAPESHNDKNIGVANQIGFRHIAFAVIDIEYEISRLKEHGVEFFSDIKCYPKTGKKLVYFDGPDNIILEFAQYPE